MRKKIICSLLAFCIIVTLFTVAASAEKEEQIVIPHTYLTSEECAETFGNLEGYYENLSQKSLDFFMQQKCTTVEDYIAYTQAQACEISEANQAAMDDIIASVADKMADAGMKLPDNVSVAIAFTTMKEACGAGGYTHGTTIFLNSEFSAYLENLGDSLSKEKMEIYFAHELFHCLTRNNPKFRTAMYSLIGFTVTDSEFVIPDYVHEQMIANPDVGHHDSYATFTINGEKKDGYLVFLTEDEFEQPGDSFFDGMYTGIVTLEDGMLYNCEQASDFYDIVGRNTDYCEDPEECMAMNFSYAVVYGMDGPSGAGYETPELIENIIALMQSGDF